ncbi:hypothetical protein [Streptomyces sp. NPDC001153]
MSGFTDWVRTVAGSEDAAGFRSRVTDPENASMGQSLAFKPSYKSGYCLAVRPAGEAQRYAERRFPHKPAKEVSGGWRAPARRSADSSGGPERQRPPAEPGRESWKGGERPERMD